MAVFSMAGGSPALPTYPLQRSVRLRSSASAYFNRTYGSPTSGTTFTYSCWVKRGTIGVQQALFSGTRPGNFDRITFNSTDTLYIQFNDGTTNLAYLETTQVFRDPSAWYHFVFTFDTSQATAANRLKIYVNGTQVTAFSTATYPAQNTTSFLNANTVAVNIGRVVTAVNYFDGYLTEVNFIDGQALTPSSFGAYNSYGVWSPAKYTGTYGTNGFYLNFQDNSALTTTANVGIGKDSSGNGNYWTSNNISITAGVTYDSMLDVPTNTSNTNANFAVLNPLYGTGITANFFLDAANLNLNVNTNSGYRNLATTFSPEGFKGYFEVALTTSPNFQIGFAYESIVPSNLQYTSANTFYLNYVGDVYNGATLIKSSCVPTLASSDILQVAFDFTGGARNVWFGRNGTWGSNSVGVGDPANGTNPVLTVSNIAQASRFYFAINSGAGTVTIAANFGQRPFTYTPPTGFNRLNTYNLPDSIVPVGAQYMAATTYTGTGSSLSVANTTTGFSMQPDLVWIKSRSAATDHKLTDSVRGTTKALISDTTGAETTDVNGLTAFGTSGFTIGSDSVYNTNAATYVGWQWRASNASAVTNTSGSITSQVSANQTAGFSIVTYTGTGANATVGHGLGVAPKMVIVKNRTSGTYSWPVWHTSLTSGQYVCYLNLTAAQVSASSTFTAAPTSTVLNLGSSNESNAATGMVAYCWAEVPGYSKFGSYTGNGSTDGPFVFTNFRPRFILYKDATNAGSWSIYDSSRNTYNVVTEYLFPDSSAAAGNQNVVDFTANGFKIRYAGGYNNTNGATIIYAAFAENPFKNALAR